MKNNKTMKLFNDNKFGYLFSNIGLARDYSKPSIMNKKCSMPLMKNNIFSNFSFGNNMNKKYSSPFIRNDRSSKNKGLVSKIVDKYSPIEQTRSGYINKKYNESKENIFKSFNPSDLAGKFDKQYYEQIPMSERDRNSIIEEYDKILKTQTPEQMKSQLKREKEAFDMMSPQERTKLFNANMEFLRQMSPQDKQRLMAVNFNKMNSINQDNEREFVGLAERRRYIKDKFKEKLNTGKQSNYYNFPLEDNYSEKDISEEEKLKQFKKLQEEGKIWEDDKKDIDDTYYEKQRKEALKAEEEYRKKDSLREGKPRKTRTEEPEREYTQEDIEKVYADLYNKDLNTTAAYRETSKKLNIPVKQVIKLYNIKQKEFIPEHNLRKKIYFETPKKSPHIEEEEDIIDKPYIPINWELEKIKTYARKRSNEEIENLIKNSDGDLAHLSKTYRIPHARLVSAQRRMQGAYRRGI